MTITNTSNLVGRFTIGSMQVDLFQESETKKYYYTRSVGADRMYVLQDMQHPGRVTVGMIDNLCIAPPLP